MAVVTGKLESSKWEDDDGNKRTSWRINADRVYFGDSKKEDQKEDPPKKSYKRR
jgi:single-stranded DNA-binding protein